MLKDDMLSTSRSVEQRAKSSISYGYTVRHETKYIIFDVGGEKKPVTFFEMVHHKEMAEHMNRMVHKSQFNSLTVVPLIIPVSAGFVSMDSTTGKIWCHGRSESMNLDSKPEDTDILLKYMQGFYQ